MPTQTARQWPPIPTVRQVLAVQDPNRPSPGPFPIVRRYCQRIAFHKPWRVNTSVGCGGRIYSVAGPAKEAANTTATHVYDTKQRTLQPIGSDDHEGDARPIPERRQAHRIC